MSIELDHRQHWRRIIGVERRGAPMGTLLGNPLPDPTRLKDEDFEAALKGEDRNQTLGRQGGDGNKQA